MTTFINNDPVDTDWANRFGFGNPRSTKGLQGICIHTTENPIGAPSEGVANYQLNTESGSYHVLVDNTMNDNINSLRENTDDWETWSAGSKGNQIALHVSFVAYSACTRAQWLAADRMLNEGADVVAYWCKRYGFPVAKINGADLRAGRRGLFGHGDVSAAWREVDHTDPGANFPWDVFIDKVKRRMNPAPAPRPQPAKETDMSLTPEQDRMLRETHTMLKEVRFQLTGSDQIGKFPGLPQSGGRTLYDLASATAEIEGVTGTKDIKER